MQAVELTFGRPNQADPHEILERGDIVLFRETPFDMPAAEREFILSVRLNPEFHKNIAFKPNTDRISGVAKLEADSVARLQTRCAIIPAGRWNSRRKCCRVTSRGGGSITPACVRWKSRAANCR